MFWVEVHFLVQIRWFFLVQNISSLACSCSFLKMADKGNLVILEICISLPIILRQALFATELIPHFI